VRTDGARPTPVDPIDAENARSYSLRDELLALIDARATAQDLRTSEVLMAVNDVYAVLLLQVAGREGRRGPRREVLYRRAARALVNTALGVDEEARGAVGGRGDAQRRPGGLPPGPRTPGVSSTSGASCAGRAPSGRPRPRGAASWPYRTRSCASSSPPCAPPARSCVLRCVAGAVSGPGLLAAPHRVVAPHSTVMDAE
jgi:hypothetical protein